MYQQLGQKQSISKIYNNIGIVYKSQKNLQKALDYLQKALKQQQLNGEQTVPVTMTNIGAVYFELQNDAKAFEYYTAALKVFSNIENTRGLALLKSYLGDYYKKEKSVSGCNLAI